MSTEFAEKIIDSMVDENGHCGERGLSEKQFRALASCKGMEDGEIEERGGWHGDYGHIDFWGFPVEGNIGKYHVKLDMFHHFNDRYTVTEISLRPQAEIEEERKLAKLLKFEGSEWQYEEKQRVELELILVNRYSYEREAYTYGTEIAFIYTFADADGNCYVWKTTNDLGMWVDGGDGYEDWLDVLPLDTVTMKATIKAPSEYRGVKQTVINRPKITGVKKVQKIF